MKGIFSVLQGLAQCKALFKQMQLEALRDAFYLKIQLCFPLLKKEDKLKSDENLFHSQTVYKGSR